MILGLSRTWSFTCYGLTLLFVLPLVAILVQAVVPDPVVFDHLVDTVLPSYLRNSVLLISGVLLIATLLAVPAAWLIARCHFFGRRFFQWSLLLPLAMPGYIVAYVYTDLLDYAGPLQIKLRAWFGWRSQADYYFPEIRSLGGASLMLALVLFPYIYLLARTAFSEQSSSLLQASRVMGVGPWHSFWRLSLPMARPAIAAGMALVAMETAADFATVNYFAVPTLTTAVYDTWLEYGSLSAAAKLSAIMLLVIFSIIGVERYARRKQELYQKSQALASEQAYRLSKLQAGFAWGYCTSLLLFAFVIPSFVLLGYGLDYFSESWTTDFWRFSGNSFVIAAIVASLSMCVALLLMFVQRVSPRPMDGWLSRVASTGYALPGTVLAIGCLVPFSYFDFAINDLALYLGLEEPGLVLSGSLFALVFAFCVRFLAIGIGSLDASYKRISPSLDMATITMGRKPLGLLLHIHLPLLKRGMLTGGLLIFIESMKELPAALLLKPIGFENLATYVYQFVSDEQLEQGALAAIVIVLVGLVPLIYINRSLELNT